MKISQDIVVPYGNINDQWRGGGCTSLLQDFLVKNIGKYFRTPLSIYRFRKKV